MAYEPKDNTGSLFKNDKREKDSQPHARGEAMIGGVLYEVAAWTKEGRNGRFQSLSFKEKEASRERQDNKPKRSYGEAARIGDGGGESRMAYDLDDQIPFAPEWR